MVKNKSQIAKNLAATSPYMAAGVAACLDSSSPVPTHTPLQQATTNQTHGAGDIPNKKKIIQIIVEGCGFVAVLCIRPKRVVVVLVVR